ncbi:carbamoyltransferase N-terminal domain-containing protein [Catellatospora sichuanensis]|uniref:carbamoyltransferase N-terminal domain-containing protein n=1 Tax=Catellatospora sichuanensis TaxID=1969805 RepID=UPI001C9292E6|nr:carbamoyltransferase N-terminal domain-containing protein [Catellatospora sichuanensis]
MSELVLGISAYYHDSAAALVCDGRPVAAAREERFTRRRHDSAFPARAVAYTLSEARCHARGRIGDRLPGGPGAEVPPRPGDISGRRPVRTGHLPGHPAGWWTTHPNISADKRVG